MYIIVHLLLTLRGSTSPPWASFILLVLHHSLRWWRGFPRKEVARGSQRGVVKPQLEHSISLAYYCWGQERGCQSNQTTLSHWGVSSACFCVETTAHAAQAGSSLSPREAYLNMYLLSIVLHVSLAPGDSSSFVDADEMILMIWDVCFLQVEFICTLHKRRDPQVMLDGMWLIFQFQSH